MSQLRKKRPLIRWSRWRKSPRCIFYACSIEEDNFEGGGLARGSFDGGGILHGDSSEGGSFDEISFER
jgi:hypothetical protein